MRTSHKAKDAAAERQSYVCDTFTGHGKAHQPSLPGSPVCVFPVMLLGKAGEGAAVDLVRGGCGNDAVGESGGLERHLRQGCRPFRHVLGPRSAWTGRGLGPERPPAPGR